MDTVSKAQRLRDLKSKILASPLLKGAGLLNTSFTVSEQSMSTDALQRVINQCNTLDYYHKFMVTNMSENCTRHHILKAILDCLHPVTLTPVCFKNKSNLAVFLASNCREAIMKIISKRFSIPNPADESKPFKVVITCNFIATANIDASKTDNLDDVLISHFNIETKTLNLNNLCTDEDILNYYALYVPKVMLNVMSLATELDPTSIELQNNFLKDINSIYPLNKTELVCLDLRNNEISSLEDLECLKHFVNLKTLYLGGNPICTKYDSYDYVIAITSICKSLKTLDQFALNSPPACRKNFICNPEAKYFASQFMEHFFTVYDDSDRQHLADIYDKNAIFSVTSRIIPFQTNSDSTDLTHYGIDNPFAVRGVFNILEVFEEFPKTYHDPYTFVCDVLFFEPTFVALSIGGLFREGKNVLIFTRTFLLKRSSEEYLITNDQLVVQNAKDIQVGWVFRFPSVNSYLPYFSDQYKMVVEVLHRLTKMNRTACQKYLFHCQYDLVRALQGFSELHVRDKIPKELFAPEKNNTDDDDPFNKMLREATEALHSSVTAQTVWLTLNQERMKRWKEPFKPIPKCTNKIFRKSLSSSSNTSEENKSVVTTKVAQEISFKASTGTRTINIETASTSASNINNEPSKEQQSPLIGVQNARFQSTFKANIPPPKLLTPLPKLLVQPPNVSVPPPNVLVPPSNVLVPPSNVLVSPPNISIPPPNISVSPPATVSTSIYKMGYIVNDKALQAVIKGNVSRAEIKQNSAALDSIKETYKSKDDKPEATNTERKKISIEIKKLPKQLPKPRSAPIKTQTAAASNKTAIEINTSSVIQKPPVLLNPPATTSKVDPKHRPNQTVVTPTNAQQQQKNKPSEADSKQRPNQTVVTPTNTQQQQNKPSEVDSKQKPNLTVVTPTNTKQQQQKNKPSEQKTAMTDLLNKIQKSLEQKAAAALKQPASKPPNLFPQPTALLPTPLYPPNMAMQNQILALQQSIMYSTQNAVMYQNHAAGYSGGMYPGVGAYNEQFLNHPMFQVPPPRIPNLPTTNIMEVVMEDVEDIYLPCPLAPGNGTVNLPVPPGEEDSVLSNSGNKPNQPGSTTNLMAKVVPAIQQQKNALIPQGVQPSVAIPGKTIPNKPAIQQPLATKIPASTPVAKVSNPVQTANVSKGIKSIPTAVQSKTKPVQDSVQPGTSKASAASKSLSILNPIEVCFYDIIVIMVRVKYKNWTENESQKQLLKYFVRRMYFFAQRLDTLLGTGKRVANDRDVHILKTIVKEALPKIIHCIGYGMLHVLFHEMFQHEKCQSKVGDKPQPQGNIGSSSLIHICTDTIYSDRCATLLNRIRTELRSRENVFKNLRFPEELPQPQTGQSLVLQGISDTPKEFSKYYENMLKNILMEMKKRKICLSFVPDRLFNILSKTISGFVFHLDNNFHKELNIVYLNRLINLMTVEITSLKSENFNNIQILLIMKGILHVFVHNMFEHTKCQGIKKRHPIIPATPKCPNRGVSLKLDLCDNNIYHNKNERFLELIYKRYKYPKKFYKNAVYKATNKCNYTGIDLNQRLKNVSLLIPFICDNDNCRELVSEMLKPTEPWKKVNSQELEKLINLGTDYAITNIRKLADMNKAAQQNPDSALKDTEPADSKLDSSSSTNELNLSDEKTVKSLVDLTLSNEDDNVSDDKMLESKDTVIPHQKTLIDLLGIDRLKFQGTGVDVIEALIGLLHVINHELLENSKCKKNINISKLTTALCYNAIYKQQKRLNSIRQIIYDAELKLKADKETRDSKYLATEDIKDLTTGNSKKEPTSLTEFKESPQLRVNLQSLHLKRVERKTLKKKNLKRAREPEIQLRGLSVMIKREKLEASPKKRRKMKTNTVIDEVNYNLENDVMETESFVKDEVSCDLENQQKNRHTEKKVEIEEKVYIDEPKVVKRTTSTTATEVSTVESKECSVERNEERDTEVLDSGEQIKSEKSLGKAAEETTHKEKQTLSQSSESKEQTLLLIKKVQQFLSTTKEIEDKKNPILIKTEKPTNAIDGIDQDKEESSIKCQTEIKSEVSIKQEQATEIESGNKEEDISEKQFKTESALVIQSETEQVGSRNEDKSSVEQKAAIEKKVNVKKEITNVEEEITNVKEEITNVEEEITNIKGEKTNVKEEETNVKDEKTKVEKETTNVEEKETNVEEMETDVDGMETNVEEMETNVEKKNTNVEEEKMIVEKENTTVEEKTNVEKEKTNVEKMETNVEKKKTNVEKKKTNVKKKKTNVEEEITNAKEEITNVEEEITNIKEEKTIVEKMETNVEKQKTNVEKKKTNVEEEKTIVKKEKTTVEEKTNVEKMETNVEKEKTNVKEEKTVVEKEISNTDKAKTISVDTENLNVNTIITKSNEDSGGQRKGPATESEESDESEKKKRKIEAEEKTKSETANALKKEQISDTEDDQIPCKKRKIDSSSSKNAEGNVKESLHQVEEPSSSDIKTKLDFFSIEDSDEDDDIFNLDAFSFFDKKQEIKDSVSEVKPDYNSEAEAMDEEKCLQPKCEFNKELYIKLDVLDIESVIREKIEAEQRNNLSAIQNTDNFENVQNKEQEDASKIFEDVASMETDNVQCDEIKDLKEYDETMETDKAFDESNKKFETSAQRSNQSADADSDSDLDIKFLDDEEILNVGEDRENDDTLLNISFS